MKQTIANEFGQVASQMRLSAVPVTARPPVMMFRVFGVTLAKTHWRPMRALRADSGCGDGRRRQQLDRLETLPHQTTHGVDGDPHPARIARDLVEPHLIQRAISPCTTMLPPQPPHQAAHADGRRGDQRAES
jgi:hypothetical protein